MSITSNKYYLHLLTYSHFYLPVLALLLLSSIYLLNYARGLPLILGPESYYHLSAFQNRAPVEYFPLGMLVSFIPEKALFILPVLLTLGTLLLLPVLLSRLGIKDETQFLFSLFLVLTPAFLYSGSTLSAAMLVLFLMAAGFILLSNEGNKSKILSFAPLVLISFIDLFSTVITLFLLLLYRSHQRNGKSAKEKITKEKSVQEKKITTKIIWLLSLLLVLNALLFREAFVLGPFHIQDRTADLVSDLGGLSGIGFTVVLLSVIGILLFWHNCHYRWLYGVLLGILAVYIYSTQAILYLSVVAAFFAAVGFQALFRKKWSQPTLKMFTLLLVLLSICFSTVSYLQRISAPGPSQNDIAALTWIKENIPTEKSIVALPGQGYYVRYFSGHEPFYEPHQREKELREMTVLNSTYIGTTFPILEEHAVGAVYVTPDWKEKYPADQGGLLFLLKNERFKLEYSSKGYEVWKFE